MYGLICCFLFVFLVTAAIHAACALFPNDSFHTWCSHFFSLGDFLFRFPVIRVTMFSGRATSCFWCLQSVQIFLESVALHLFDRTKKGSCQLANYYDGAQYHSTTGFWLSGRPTGGMLPCITVYICFTISFSALLKRPVYPHYVVSAVSLLTLVFFFIAWILVQCRSAILFVGHQINRSWVWMAEYWGNQ